MHLSIILLLNTNFRTYSFLLLSNNFLQFRWISSSFATIIKFKTFDGTASYAFCKQLLLLSSPSKCGTQKLIFSDLHENFITDVSLDKLISVKLWFHLGGGLHCPNAFVFIMTTIWSGRILSIGCNLEIFTSCLYCVIAFHFTISMYLLRTVHPMFHCICMYVDVMVCVCQT